MNNAKIKNDIEKTLNLLEEIAKKYDNGSLEHEAINCAAKALLFVHMRGIAKQFKNFMDTSTQELSDTQREYLRSLGIYEE
jgi:hypothetical protein